MYNHPLNNTEMFTAQNPLTALLTRPRPKTCAELRSIVGQPYAACLICGSPLFSVTNLGEVVCWGCDWDRANAPKGIALRILIVVPHPTNTPAMGGSSAGELSQVAAGNGPGGAGEASLQSGMGVAADYDAILADRERTAEIDAGAYYLDRPDAMPGRPRRWRIIPIDNVHYPRPLRDKTADEWFEGLPTE